MKHCHSQMTFICSSKILSQSTRFNCSQKNLEMLRKITSKPQDQPGHPQTPSPETFFYSWKLFHNPFLNLLYFPFKPLLIFRMALFKVSLSPFVLGSAQYLVCIDSVCLGFVTVNATIRWRGKMYHHWMTNPYSYGGEVVQPWNLKIKG